MAVLTELDQFWIRFNNAQIDCACLGEEKAALLMENRDLKDKLKIYLTNVTIAEGSGGNAREKLRPSSMKVEKIGYIDFNNGEKLASLRVRRRPVTCIEANLCNAVRSRSLVSNKLKLPNYFSIVNRI